MPAAARKPSLLVVPPTPAKPRSTSRPQLRTPPQRRALDPGRRIFEPIGNGIALAYDRAASGNGTWFLRVRHGDGAAGTYRLHRLASADDVTAADGANVLTHAQALAAALARGADARRNDVPVAPVTLAEACESYVRTALEPRGVSARPRDARVAFAKHLGDLADKPARLLTERDAKAAAARIPPRVVTAIKAALNGLDTGARPSDAVLRALRPPPGRTRRVGVENVPSDSDVAAMIARAHAVSPMFGAFVATLAATGARPGQVTRLRGADLQRDVLVIPPSAKGRASKPKPHARVPVSAELAGELRTLAAGRNAPTPLFVLPVRERDATPGGTGWRLTDRVRPLDRVTWDRLAALAGIERLYDLRHAAVVRLALRGVPLRVIAAAVDSSVAMLERVYSRHISAAAEDVLRAALTP